MQKRIQAAMGAALFAAVATVWLAPGVQADPRAECVVTIDAEALPISAEPIAVKAKYTESVGEQVAAVFPEESGVEVVSLTHEGDDEGQAVRLTLNTSEAQAGEWQLTLRGDEGECRGTVLVVEAETGTR